MTKYYYNGVPVAQQLSNMKYQRFFRAVLEKGEDSAKIVFKRVKRGYKRKKGKNTLFVGKIPLTVFCERHKLNYYSTAIAMRENRLEEYLVRKRIPGFVFKEK
jgi:hypothetical protein